MLFDIVPADSVQQSLFAIPYIKQTLLMQTIDDLNRVYEKNTVFLASQGIRRNWQMKRGQMTKAYTTRWEDIPVVS